MVHRLQCEARPLEGVVLNQELKQTQEEDPKVRQAVLQASGRQLVNVSCNKRSTGLLVIRAIKPEELTNTTSSLYDMSGYVLHLQEHNSFSILPQPKPRNKK